MKIKVYRDLMGANDKWANKTRALLAKAKVKMLNLIGSPGAGKTALLEETVKQISGKLKLRRHGHASGVVNRNACPALRGAVALPLSESIRLGRARASGSAAPLKFPAIKLAVLEGDIETRNDAERLARLNCRVSQLLTGGGCHLEAKMVHYAVRDLPLRKLDLVIVENVGNLVCPAEFDIGEHAKVVVISVTEGEDKPLKYPTIFREAKAIVISKIDLLPHVPFKLNRCFEFIRKINPRAPIFRVSVLAGEGIEEWINWLTSACADVAPIDCSPTSICPADRGR